MLDLHMSFFLLLISVWHLLPQETTGACLGENVAQYRPSSYPTFVGDNLTNGPWLVTAVTGGDRTNLEECISIYFGRPWWYVDLGDETTVKTVVFIYRVDKAQPKAGLTIRLTNTTPPADTESKICYEHKGLATYEVVAAECRGNSRYIIVSLDLTPPLFPALFVKLCQMEVYRPSDGFRGDFFATPPTVPVRQFQALTSPTMIGCALTCADTDVCVGFNYATQTKACALFRNSTTASGSLPEFTLDCS